MVELPFMTLVVSVELLMVLLAMLSVASRVTTVPDIGNIALEFLPVPPAPVPRTPVTAAPCERSIAPKLGTVAPAASLSTWCSWPAPVDIKLLPPLPRMTPLLVKLVAPVPPTVTAKLPDVMTEAGKFGTSLATSDMPSWTRPLTSTQTLG